MARELLNQFVQEFSAVEVRVKGADPELQTNANAFCSAYAILNTFLGMLGTAFSFVQSDITTKLQNIKEHNHLRGDNMTLEGIVQAEIKENTLRTPTSAGRNLLRLVRALDFLVRLFEGLDKKQELSVCANEAYNNTLKNHHTWVVRTMVAVAFRTLPYRVDFLVAMGLDPEEENFKQIVTLMRPLGERLSHFYSSNHIEDLA